MHLIIYDCESTYISETEKKPVEDSNKVNGVCNENLSGT